MANFDIPAFTRGITGAVTAGLEGKRKAEDRAREQQRQVMADLLSKRRVEETEAAGRATRQRQAAAAAERKLRADELEAQREAALQFINDQLPEDQRVDIGAGMSSERAVKEAERRRTIIQRRTEADAASARISGRQRTTTPKPLAQDARVRRVVSEYKRLVRAGLNPDDDLLARMQAGDINVPVPVDTAQVRQQAMLEATGLFKHEFTEEELPELTTILDGIVGQGGEEGAEPSIEDIRQMIRDLSAQGLSPEEIQANLAQRGINVRL